MRNALILSIMIMATALAGCATNDTTTTPTGSTTPTGASPTPTTATTPTPVVDMTPTISTITVGTEAAYPPFEDFVDNQIVGFDIDVMKEIAQRAGFTVTFQNSDFSAIIPSVQNDQFQAGISAFTITDERKQQVDFSVPYYENSLMAGVRTATEGVNAPEDLKGKKVCTQQGTTSEIYLREQLEFTEENLVLLGSAPLCADALKRGDVEAFMIDAAFVRSVIAANEGEIKQAFIIDDVDEQFGIAIAKGNTELLVAINQALNAMKDDGTLDALKAQWQV